MRQTKKIKDEGEEDIVKVSVNPAAVPTIGEAVHPPAAADFISGENCLGINETNPAVICSGDRCSK